MADGKKIKVKKMTDNHLMNTVAMLKRRGIIHYEDYLDWLDQVCWEECDDQGGRRILVEGGLKTWKKRGNYIYEEARRRELL